MLERHGWLIHALSSLMLYGAGKARYDEHRLDVYELAGFEGASVDQAAAAAFMFVLGNAIGPAAAAALARRQARPAGGGERLEVLVERFPRLGARSGSHAATTAARRLRALSSGWGRA